MKIKFLIVIGVSLVLTDCSYKRKLTAEEIRLSPLFSSGMILQASPNTTITGYASPGSKLAVKIAEYLQVVTADGQGKWEAEFPEIIQTKPFTIYIEGKDTIIRVPDVRAGKIVILIGDAYYNVLDDREENSSSNYFDSLRSSSIWILDRETTNNTQIPTSFNGSWIRVEKAPYSRKTENALRCIYRVLGKINRPIGIIDATWPEAKLDAWLNPGDFHFNTDSTAHDKKNLELNLTFNLSLLDTIEFLRDSNRNAFKSGVLRIWFNDENWLTANLPVDFAKATLPANKRVVYLRKKIYIPEKFATSDFIITLGYIKGNVEFFFNEKKIEPTLTNDAYSLTIPDTLIHEWNNLLCIRLFCSDKHSGIYGSYFNCRTVDSSFLISINNEWKYNFNLEPDFPEYRSITSEPGILFNFLVKGLKEYPVDEFIWYGGYYDFDNPASVSKKIQKIVQYFEHAKKKTILFTPFNVADSIVYNDKTDMLYKEMNTAAKNSMSTWMELKQEPPSTEVSSARSYLKTR
jgi:sialate O-acetylesterase